MTHPPTLDARAVRTSRGPRPTIAGALADLVLDSGCAGCGHGEHVLCPTCARALDGPAYAAPPDPAPAGLPTPWSVGPYEGVLRAVLLAHKEHARLALAGPIGVALARSVTAAAPGPGELVIVPVPSRRSAVRTRGHDALARTARAAARALRREGRSVTVLPVLRPGRRLDDQAGLSTEHRRANLAGALVVPASLTPLVAGRRVVVVDDVVTTGSTLTEAVRALRVAGTGSVAVAVVAATVRRVAGVDTLLPRDGAAG